MIYAHAPAGAKKQVRFSVEENRTVVMDVAVGGSFVVLDEATGRTTPVEP